MIDTTTTRGRIIAAALALAAERPWATVTLADIADRAGVALVEFKSAFDSKAAIVTALAAAVDDEMLRRVPRRAAGQSARDALFEVIMCRFDVLQPYRAALRSIAAAGGVGPAQIAALLNTQHWMLAAAGVASEGLGGTARTLGLATVYASVFRTWLDDDDPGQARTMAALDRRLRRGEATLTRVDEICAGIGRLLGGLAPGPRGGKAADQSPPPPQ